jgi:hypothetical protein
MKRMFAGVGLLLLSAGSAFSEPGSCDRRVCPNEVRIASVADDKVYGLLIGAPDAGCQRVRYRVETEGRVLLGKTPALAAGEVAVVRLGNGFRPGAHTLIVTAEGCGRAPRLSRSVTLGKLSPDHGWRAAVISASSAVTR